MHTGRESGRGGPGIGGPLLGSAAAHLAFLACLLLVRAAVSPEFPGVVPVVLLEESPGDDSAKEKRLAAIEDVGPERTEIPLEAERVLPPVIPASPPPKSSTEKASVPPDSGPGSGEVGERYVPGPFEAPAGAIAGLPREAETSGGGSAAGRGMPRGMPAGGGGADRERPETRLLRERIESRIVYPEEAIRRGQEGEVLLRIRIGEGGIPKEIRVARSSGARTLDEAARNGVVRSAPLPSTPGWFEVPVRFRLR
jgi:protein TonB